MNSHNNKITTSVRLGNCLNIPDVKNILILTSCTFTTQGFIQLCNRNPFWNLICLNPVENSSTKSFQKKEAELLITDLYFFDDASWNSLVKTRSLPDKILLITEYYNGGAQHYRTTLGLTFITDKSASLKSLEHLISKALSSEILESNFNSGKHQRARMNECEVLLSLLNGEKPGTVAKKMGITYNAVSRYKKLALKRVGVKNINEIIAGKQLIYFNEFYKSSRYL